MAVQPALHIVHPMQLIIGMAKCIQQFLLCLDIRFPMYPADCHGTTETDTGHRIRFTHPCCPLKAEKDLFIVRRK